MQSNGLAVGANFFTFIRIVHGTVIIFRTVESLRTPNPYVGEFGLLIGLAICALPSSKKYDNNIFDIYC